MIAFALAGRRPKMEWEWWKMGNRKTRRARILAKGVGYVMEGMEGMEGRVLLAGVTLITHGFQLVPGSPSWLHGMEVALSNRMGGASVYRLTLGANLLPGLATVESFQQVVAGPSDNAESIIDVDWSSVADPGLNPIYTGQIASLIAPYLTSAGVAGSPEAAPFAEVPIHLIGHSRGASMVGALAEDLGKDGLWVDQVTFLDSHPVSPDWGDSGMFVPGNVAFADSYWREDGANPLQPFDFDGEPVDGAANVHLSEDVLSQAGYGGNPISLNGSPQHSDVHLWYHGTIDTFSSISDGGVDPFIPDNFNWYSNNGESQTTRSKTGYDYSRIGNGPRPIAGLWAAFGGTGTRPGISGDPTIGTQWPNIGKIVLSGSSKITIGNQLSLSYLYQDDDSSLTITWFADTDNNPYDAGAKQLPDPQPAGTTSSFFVSGTYSGSTAGLNSTYKFIYAKVTDSDNHTRYAYLPTALTFTPPPSDITPPTATLSFPTNNGNVASGTINNTQHYIDITFSDASGIDAASILDAAPEFSLQGSAAGGVSISSTPTLVQGTTYRYALSGGGFGLGPVTVDFPVNSFEDTAHNGNSHISANFNVVSKPVITLVDPGTLKPLPDTERQLLTIKGTGFNAQSTLNFVSANQNPFTGRIPAYNSSSGALTYAISVGTTEGEWSVVVVTNGVASDPYKFQVAAGAPVAAPTILPGAGPYNGSVQITLASDTIGATIRYTLDGTDPNAASAIYTGAFTLSSSLTLKARAFKSGMADSTVLSAAFTITPLPAAPQIDNVSPGLLQPSDLIQSISIYGSGFLPSCQLSFYDPNGQLVQNNETIFVTSGHLDYGLGVNAKSGTWTVKVVNDPYSGSPKSSNLYSFTVAQPPTGNYPTPVSPANGETGLPQLNTILSWQAVPGASTYTVLVATDAESLPTTPNGSQGAGVVWISTGITTQNILGFFIPGITVYWEVHATIEGVTNGWSPIWSFTITGELNLPPVVQSGAVSPDTVTLGDPLTFTASGVSDPNLPPDHVRQVFWYVETNGIEGLQTDGPNADIAFVDNDGSDGWSVTLSTFGWPARNPPITAGTHTVYTVAVDSKSSYSAPAASFTFTLLPADVPDPVIESVAFDLSITPPAVSLHFNVNVAPSLIGAYLVVRAGNTFIDIKKVDYDYASNTALLRLDTAQLPNSDYSLSIPFLDEIFNASGVTLQGQKSFIFSYLAGDANRDRSVGFPDLVAVAQNYGATAGKGWADGDFNGDGIVNFADLVTVAQNYGKSLPAPAPLPAPAAFTPTKPSPLAPSAAARTAPPPALIKPPPLPIRQPAALFATKIIRPPLLR